MPQDPSLFGVSPEMYLQSQQAAASKAAQDFALMDPSQRGAYGLFMAGRQTAGALGAEDPMVNILRQRQAVTQEIDPNDPVSFRAAAKKLFDAKDYQGAEHLVKTSRELEKTLAEAFKERATGIKALREGDTNEMRNAASLADGEGLQRGTPQWAEAFRKHLGELTAKADSASKVVGVAEGSKEPVYEQGGQQYVYRMVDGKQTKVPYAGAVDRLTSKVSVSAKGGDVIEEDAYSKNAGKNYADLEQKAMEQARSSAAALRNLGQMKAKAAAGVYSGPQAQMTLDAANFLDSLGLLSKDQVAKLANSTEFDKYAKDLVMQDLGGKLGAQVSDADRKFVEARIPQLTTNPKARQELIDKLAEIHGRNIDYYRKMQAHLSKNRTLKGFDFADADGMSTSGQTPAAPAASSSTLSDQDLLNKYLKK